ncbi:adenine nucleotide alpha hydrolase family protein [Thermodesulfatator atlanticus]|uniref:universal stress protein n=1 Tax=Thermodesulfatator atlanticus TaxID=501497 RepID=UPI0003B451FA|nr:universal stress protein [Thermodesulfatator atlanticus]
MERIVFIEQVEREPKNISYALQIARQKGAKLSVLFLVPVALETADWIDVQEKQIKEKKEKLETVASKIKEEAQKLGVELEYKIVEYLPRAFLLAMKEFSPADLIITGDLDLSPLAGEGIKHLEDLSIRMRCPVLSIKTLLPQEKASKKKIFTRMAIFGSLSALSYFGFFPMIDKLNYKIFMTGTIYGAIAVLLTVPIHAYIYGSFAECLPKLLGLEKSAGGDH